MARKRGYRGTIGRILAHGGSLDVALEKAAEDWITGVSNAKANYEAGLGEYIAWYIPKVEGEYQNILDSTPDYFADTNRSLRERTATQIMEITHQLAQEWKKERAKRIIAAKTGQLQKSGGYGGYTMRYGRSGGAASKETPKKVVSEVRL